MARCGKADMGAAARSMTEGGGRLVQHTLVIAGAGRRTAARCAHQPPHCSWSLPVQVRLQSLLGPYLTAALKLRLPQHL